MAPSRPSLSIAAPIALVSVLALGLSVLLHITRLDDSVRDIDESRLRFTLGELRGDFDTRLALGLPLKGLANAAEALERETHRDPDLLAATVVDTAGIALFSSGRGPAMPPAVLLRQSGREWLLREPGTITLGARLSRRGGAPAGTLVLRYAVARQVGAIDMVARELTLATVCAVVLTTLCVVFGAQALVRRMDGRLAAMKGALGQPRTGAADLPSAEPLVDDVNLMATSALHDLAAARDTLAPVRARL